MNHPSELLNKDMSDLCELCEVDNNLMKDNHLFEWKLESNCVEKASTDESRSISTTHIEEPFWIEMWGVGSDRPERTRTRVLGGNGYFTLVSGFASLGLVVLSLRRCSPSSVGFCSEQRPEDSRIGPLPSFSPPVVSNPIHILLKLFYLSNR